MRNSAIQEWHIQMAEEFKGDYDSIGRAVAIEYDLPWATVWDHKQRLLSGEFTATELPTTGPKILLFDIETAPILAHVWGLWNNNVGLNQIQEDWHMLSWSAKWFGEDTVYHDNLYRYQERFANDPCDDEAIIRSLYEMINEADIIIGHNVKKFDNKKFKARCLFHGLKPLSSYRIIDTLDIAKQEFALSSNKLDFLATYLGFENKVSHEGHTLWTKCMQGYPEAWDIMEEYNDYDVVLLENVYLKLRPWFRRHPNVAVYYDDHHVRCNCCGSKEIYATGKTAKTNLSAFTEFRCDGCGKVSRDGFTNLTKEKRAALLRNIS